MSKKAWLGLLIALFLPLISYLVVKVLSDDAVVMPKRYYVDSVITKEKDGKQITDTIWHRLPDFSMVNQLGDTVSMSDLKGKVIVADFFFTRCPSICPKLTRNMKELQDALKLKDFSRRIDTTFVHFLSFTVDPKRDSVSALKAYADRMGINHDVWWMLTAPKEQIYPYILDEFKLAAVDGEGVDSNFIHTEKMVLLDKDRVIRGYYNGLDSLDMARLAADIVLISLEKDKKKKRNLFRK